MKIVKIIIIYIKSTSQFVKKSFLIIFLIKNSEPKIMIFFPQQMKLYN